MIDDTANRKDGNATDHVARQYLGSVGKVDNGIVAETTLWANEQPYYRLHVEPTEGLANAPSPASLKTPIKTKTVASICSQRFFILTGGADGTRTRDPRRDRPVF